MMDNINYSSRIKEILDFELKNLSEKTLLLNNNLIIICRDYYGRNCYGDDICKDDEKFNFGLMKFSSLLDIRKEVGKRRFVVNSDLEAFNKLIVKILEEILEKIQFDCIINYEDLSDMLKSHQSSGILNCDDYIFIANNLDYIINNCQDEFNVIYINCKLWKGLEKERILNLSDDYRLEFINVYLRRAVKSMIGKNYYEDYSHFDTKNFRNFSKNGKSIIEILKNILKRVPNDTD